MNSFQLKRISKSRYSIVEYMGSRAYRDRTYGGDSQSFYLKFFAVQYLALFW